MMTFFENYDRRISQINTVLLQYGINSLDEAEQKL